MLVSENPEIEISLIYQLLRMAVTLTGELSQTKTYFLHKGRGQWFETSIAHPLKALSSRGFR